MSDDFFIILLISILLISLSFFVYKVYKLHRVYKKKNYSETSEQKLLFNKMDYSKELSYFLNKAASTDEDFEKEQQFLIHYVEKNNTLKQLTDCYEQVEIYLDFKLRHISDFEEKQQASFYKQRYRQIQSHITAIFEEKLNQLLAIKMSYASEMESIKPRGITTKCLAVQLLKLKVK
ncbi:hypothetical protein MTZ49_06515 [Entomomonas sp. E2T0]|uniref:hypothetical protein n=1 Tax=Entomomonas sp. E2T0 TaxID=2930213 RepID=UPI0022283D8C|nr:hypothetical protein [Entomomonas sp. E2T0]UYZ85199.1 hypothetical protein MTZ49_06515 [Entomomonas sp. E2T0]